MGFLRRDGVTRGKINPSFYRTLSPGSPLLPGKYRNTEMFPDVIKLTNVDTENSLCRQPFWSKWADLVQVLKIPQGTKDLKDNQLLDRRPLTSTKSWKTHRKKFSEFGHIQSLYNRYVTKSAGRSVSGLVGPETGSSVPSSPQNTRGDLLLDFPGDPRSGHFRLYRTLRPRFPYKFFQNNILLESIRICSSIRKPRL